MMHSYLMGINKSIEGCIKNAWQHYSQENAKSLPKETPVTRADFGLPEVPKSQRLSQIIVGSLHWANQSQDVTTVDGETTGATRNPSLNQDQGYASISDSNMLEEGVLAEDLESLEEEVFHLELSPKVKEGPKLKASSSDASMKDLSGESYVPGLSLTPPHSLNNSPKGDNQNKTADNTLVSEPTLDWNRAILTLTPGTSSSSSASSDNDQINVRTVDSRHQDVAQSEKRPHQPQQRKPSSTPYSPEDLSIYADEFITWKLALEKKHYQQSKSYTPSQPKAAAKEETGDHAILQGQKDITYDMRRTLLEWLVSVNRQFNYTLDTWCLSVDVMDRFLAKQPIHRDCLQLVGLVAFFIAAKMEETNPPEISELVSLCANSYEPKQFQWMEYIMLSHIKFDLSAPTVSFFLGHLVTLGNGSLREEESTLAKQQKEMRRDNWPWDLTRCLVEVVMCRETRCSYLGQNHSAGDAILPSHLAGKIYDFVNRNFAMTCLVDRTLREGHTGCGAAVSPDTIVNNLYQMLHLYLTNTQTDEL